MRKIIVIVTTLLFSQIAFPQQYDLQRINAIENRLTSLEADVPGLSEKINIDLQEAKLSTFLLAIAEVHRINIDVHPEIGNTTIINSFKDVEVLDVLVYLCKNQNLSIDQTGTILSISRFQEEPEILEERVIPISYNPQKNSLSAHLEGDSLSEVFKSISEKSGKGIFFKQGMGSEPLSIYIKDLPFKVAMEKIAYSNNLVVTQVKDGSYEFEKIQNFQNESGKGAVASYRPKRNRQSNFYFKVLDTLSKRLEISIENVPISEVVYDLSNALKLDVFMATPLDEAGTTNVSAKDITFDQLLTKIFESQMANASNNNDKQGNSSSTIFTFKQENNVYYFGANKQLTLRTSEIVPLYYRSIELLEDPDNSGRTVGRTVGFNSFQTFNSGNSRQDDLNNRSTSSRTASKNVNTAFESLIPEDIKNGLSITSDLELNSFIVSGPSTSIIRFKDFVKKIDKPVPVVMIEVMILDISRSATLEAGVEWGIGESATTTQGTLFPHSQVTLGANTVNRILGRIAGSSFLNIGTVVPNFFANIKAMENNGFLKIRSSPRITTLNGHRAYFSNGETSYYAVTNQTFNGVQNPITSEITNYQPIDAELSLDVKPFVSADGEITMDIKVIQSSFNGQRIAEDAPPGINSREFTSIVKARNNDIIVLGGLEEKRVSNSGSGVPLLARVPILKWLFSKRVREGSKSKLTVLIKPTVIY